MKDSDWSLPTCMSLKWLQIGPIVGYITKIVKIVGFSEEFLVQILQLIEELKQAFGASISTKDWIDQEMAQRLLEKVWISFEKKNETV